MRATDPRFRAFVFDLDGTLVDSRSAIEKAAQMAIERVAPSYSGRRVTSAIGPPIRQMFAKVLETDDASLLDALLVGFREVYDTDVCRETPAYPGVAELLTRIAGRGDSSFVLTHKPLAPTRLILSSLGLVSHVREVVTPDSLYGPFISKTNALAGVLDRGGLSPTRTVMVGDSADDAAAAEACGVAFAAALYGYGNLSAEAAAKHWLTIEEPADVILLLD
jgi:phosphoglycolate phosphatase